MSPIVNYSGDIDLLPGPKSSAKQAGLPFSLFVRDGSFRLSFLHYSQFASAANSTSGVITAVAQASSVNDALIFSFFRSIEEEGESSFFFTAGAGLFHTLVTATQLGVGAGAVELVSEDNFNLGLVASIGFRFLTDDSSVFYGAEGMFISAKNDVSAVGVINPLEVDIGGLFFSVIAGVRL